MAKAIADYKAFVASEADEFVEGTGSSSPPSSRRRRGEVAVCAGPPPVGGHRARRRELRRPRPEDRRPRGRHRRGHGLHRLPPPREGPLDDGLQKDSSAIADQLLADVNEIAAKSKTVDPTALSIANGAKALLDEVATGKITGEEERYSHTDLWDFDGNLEGSRQALAALRPVVAERDPALQKALDARFTELSSLLGTHKTGADYKSYTALTDADIKALTVRSTRSPKRCRRSRRRGGQVTPPQEPAPAAPPAPRARRRCGRRRRGASRRAEPSRCAGPAYAAAVRRRAAGAAAPAATSRSTPPSRSAASTRPASSPRRRTACTSSPSTS